MKRYKIAVLCALLLVVGVLASCNSKAPANSVQPSGSESTSDAVSGSVSVFESDYGGAGDLLALLSGGELGVSDELILQFYRYFKESPYELAMLPQFNEGQQPNWDDLTLFIHLNYFVKNSNSGSDDYSMSKELFAETVKLYLGDLAYTDRSSLYFTYENGIYTPVGGDIMRSGHYRLTDISKDADGVYTATFDGLFFAELETSADYEDASPNVKAIMNEAGVTEYIRRRSVFEEAVFSIFCKEDYRQILSMTEQVTIQFTLSGDDVFALHYLSCGITEYADTPSSEPINTAQAYGNYRDAYRDIINSVYASQAISSHGSFTGCEMIDLNNNGQNELIYTYAYEDTGAINYAIWTFREEAPGLLIDEELYSYKTMKPSLMRNIKSFRKLF